MYSSLRLILVASAVLSWTAGAHAGQPVQRTSHAPWCEAAQPSAKTMSHLEAKGGKRRPAAHHARPAAHHTHRSKVTHYRRPTVRHHAVHRTGVKPHKTTVPRRDQPSADPNDHHHSPQGRPVHKN